MPTAMAENLKGDVLILKNALNCIAEALTRANQRIEVLDGKLESASGGNALGTRVDKNSTTERATIAEEKLRRVLNTPGVKELLDQTLLTSVVYVEEPPQGKFGQLLESVGALQEEMAKRGAEVELSKRKTAGLESKLALSNIAANDARAAGAIDFQAAEAAHKLRMQRLAQEEEASLFAAGPLRVKLATAGAQESLNTGQAGQLVTANEKVMTLLQEVNRVTVLLETSLSQALVSQQLIEVLEKDMLAARASKGSQTVDLAAAETAHLLQMKILARREMQRLVC